MTKIKFGDQHGESRAQYDVEIDGGESEITGGDLYDHSTLSSHVLDRKDPQQVSATPQGQTALRKLHIFLASSSELRADRDEFDRYIREQNDWLLDQGFYLTFVRWENFLDAMSDTRLQDDYNEKVRECDVFVSLFFTKTGKFTEEEFDVAHEQFTKIRRPLIYTFFKNAEIKIGSAPKEDLRSLWDFQEKLGKLGHFYTQYNDIEHLKRQFRDQIDKILAKLKQ